LRILLTNDDGVSSPGLLLLADALRDAGHRVFVVAPDANRSGCSHSIHFLDEPCRLKEVGKDTWSCTGTPVDCVVVSLLGGIPEINIAMPDRVLDLSKAPDLVLSGINLGANLGTVLVYSGTAAAARQGSFFGIPSIALSLVDNDDEKVRRWQPVIEFITENLKEFMSYWKERTFININFPNNGKKPSAIMTAFPSIRHYNDLIEAFNAPGNRLYCFADAGKVGWHGGGNEPEEGSDWREVRNNNAALSVIMSDPVCFKDREGRS
jgi:5'-nucleotidase